MPEQNAHIVSLRPRFGCGEGATLSHMTLVASRDLRNHTSDVLRRVAEGDHVTITVNGIAVAELVPPRSSRRASMAKQDLIELLTHHQADAGMAKDLALLGEEWTEDVAHES